jgi:uncharacterized protein YndB with AHSA1/START domain
MERLFGASVERVWETLTDARMLERWLMSTSGFEARVGTRFTLRDEPREDCRALVDCEVLELSPPHRMVWSWRGADDPATTRVEIELEPAGRGTRLTLRHTGEADERTVAGTTAGWTGKLGALEELLTQDPRGWQ